MKLGREGEDGDPKWLHHQEDDAAADDSRCTIRAEE